MQPIALALALLMVFEEPASRDPSVPQAVEWPADAGEAEVVAPKTKGGVPSPRTLQPRGRIEVAVGLDPTAPGSKSEKALVDALEKGAGFSVDPPARVRRLRAGTPAARQICRAGREDLVIMVGYVSDREEPVILSHDCRLDMPLGLRTASAAHETGLVEALWDEHDALVREGVRERRRLKGLSPGARAGIVAGVALVVVGVAVGLLVASALRRDIVVLKVSP
jgi:hypothetical protein